MLIPDVWLEPLEGNRGIVLDTKWKLPAERGEGMGVESADAYQMLAYGQTYDAETLLLVYPRYRDYSEMEWDFPDGRHRLKVVEWPVGGNLEATERAMFIEAGSWLSLPVEANRVREIAADLDPGAIPPR